MTAVEAEAGRLKEEADEPGWEVDPDDEWGVAVITTVGRQLKLRREAVGMRAAEFGRAVGYGEDMIYKIEGGKRIPRQEFLDKADEVLGAERTHRGGVGGREEGPVSEDRSGACQVGGAGGRDRRVRVHQHPRPVADPEHARALFRAAQPPYASDDVERMVAARMARQSVFERDPAPAISFVLEEATLLREVGGTMVWRQQLERLLDVGRLHNVTLQVMPTRTEAHPGWTAGSKY